VNRLAVLRRRARDFFEDGSPSHDWHHVERVLQLAERIGTAEGADMETVRYAVLLHDIGRAKEDRGEIDDHAAWGADRARTILADVGIDEEVIDAVEHCIRSHRFSNDIDPETIEAQVLADADNLDALGAVGIARGFSYGGEHGTMMHVKEAPEERRSQEETQIGHIKRKILGLKDRMYTDTGQEIAQDRHEFARSFVERFEAEMDAER